MLPAHHSAPNMRDGLLLRAILVKAIPDLDLQLWNDGLTVLTADYCKWASVYADIPLTRLTVR